MIVTADGFHPLLGMISLFKCHSVTCLIYNHYITTKHKVYYVYLLLMPSQIVLTFPEVRFILVIQE